MNRLCSNVDTAIFSAVCWSLTTFVVGGCAQWKPHSSTDGLLASLKPADQVEEAASATQVSRAQSKGLIMGVDFVTIDSDKASDAALDSLWQWADETTIDVGQRKALLANGLRVGRVLDAAQFRKQLTSLGHDEGVLDEFMHTASIGSDLKQASSEHAMRLGHKYELPIGKPISGELTTLVKIGGQVIGQTLRNPQFAFSVEPSGLLHAQEVEVKFRPEVQHGDMKNQLVGADSALRINRSREVWPLDGLRWRITVREGDLIVITADHRGKVFDKKMDSIGSGLADRMMYGEHPDLGNEQLFVLVQIKQLPKE